MNNFKIQELVSKELYGMIGDNAIKLFSPLLLSDLDRFASDIKKDLGVRSVVINDWLWGGAYNQSGFREMGSDTGVPNSMHKKGGAFDLKFKGCTIQQAFKYLIANQDKYPHIRRVENIQHTPTWLHIDDKPVDYLGIHVFNP